MKLGKTSWIIIMVGIFVVLGAGLGFTRNQQLTQQEMINDELSIAEARINNLQLKDLKTEEEELQRRLDETNEQVEIIQQSLLRTVESIEVVDEFYAVNYSCNTTVDMVSSSQVKKANLSGINCLMITINAVIGGTLDQLVEVVTALNNDFTTGVVSTVRMNITEMDDANGATAQLMMEVYTYEGA